MSEEPFTSRPARQNFPASASRGKLLFPCKPLYVKIKEEANSSSRGYSILDMSLQIKRAAKGTQ